MQKLLIIASVLLPALVAVTSLLLGYMTFWYDPARDLLAAWNNLSKPTLIGPPSGIPGIFYGPYWIWLLSSGELFSKNPIVVALITATIPYFIIFPLIWFQFGKFFGQKEVIIGWLLFILGSGFTYATQLWNPYPAPLLTLLVLYLLIRFNFTTFSLFAFLITFLTGFVLGLVINFHLSFGIALLFGITLFLLWECLKPAFNKKRKNNHIFFVKISFLFTTLTGTFAAFLPTLLFEIRHGFNQIQILFQTFTKYGDVVTVEGLSKYNIFKNFIDTLSNLLHLPTFIGGGLLLIMMCSFIWLTYTKKVTIKEIDARILTLLGTIILSVGFIYFTAKNPVWAYHFIGFDIVVLILLTFLLHKISLFRKIFIVILIYILGTTVYSLAVELQTRGIAVIDKQKEVVQTIVNDAANNPYTVFAYSPSIYNYEYAYLFRFVANKEVPFDPGQNPQFSETIYLIIPTQSNPQIEDFVHFRAPSTRYTTANSWTFYNDVTILKKTSISH